MKKQKRYIIVVFALVGILVIAATSVLFNHPKLSEYDTALTVNSEPITVGEFRATLNFAYDAKTYSYFKSKYGVDAGKNFWTTSYGGEIPINYAREKTLKDEVRIKVQQILMKQNGVVSDFSYENFLKSLSDENIRRQEAVKKGQVVYGPEKFGNNEYFDYQFSNNVVKLKEKMSSEKFLVSEEVLKQRYELDKDKQYRLPDYFKLEKIRVAYDSSGNGKENAQQLIKTAQKMLDSGMTFENAAKQYNEAGKVEEQILDETTAKNDEFLYPQLKAAANSMGIGQVSGVIDAKGEFDIIKCTDKKNNRYQSYNDVRNNVKSAYIDEKYAELIDKLVSEAHVQINKKVYDAIFP